VRRRAAQSDWRGVSPDGRRDDVAETAPTSRPLKFSMKRLIEEFVGEVLNLCRAAGPRCGNLRLAAAYEIVLRGEVSPH